jgi:hypothetical protein
MNFLRPGITYTLLPVPRMDTLVLPHDEWPGWRAVPMVFDISALPYQDFLVTFSVAGNVNTCGDSVTASFAQDALWWEQEARYLDPGIPQHIAMDSAGRATLDLGMTLTLPAGTEGSLFEILVFCRIVDTLTGDTTHTSAILGADQEDNLFFEWSEIHVNGLRRGQTYTIHPGPDSFYVTPIDAGGEIVGMEPYRIVGNAGSEVFIGFILPTAFQSDDELGSFPCRFDTNSVYIEEGEQWLDPNGGTPAMIGPRCISHLRMGVTFDIPANAVPGGYTCQIIGAVTYIQKSSMGHTHPYQSEAELLIMAEVLGEEFPEKYSLSQNYPNPFNSTTTISYELPQESGVVLEVYDPLGRKIRTLVEGVRAAGIHQEHFDARNLPSGVYVYRLTAGGFRDMRKLILIR